MEATQPKVHRQHQRQRRTEARQRRLEREAAAAAATPPDQEGAQDSIAETLESCAAALNADPTSTTATTTAGTSGSGSQSASTAMGRISAQSSADSIEMVGSPSQTSQQTVVLVNGHAPPSQDTLEESASLGADDPPANARPESPTQPTKHSDGSRNSSGDAMSLRETLRQLPATHGHRSRRTHSPQSPATALQRSLEVDSSFHRGILGYIDRELKQSSPTPSALSMGAGSSGGGVGAGASRKQQSLSDPQASPAQRSLRSRNSFDKSPRRKRSKSESRRRRERKLIAAGEMEVRQANETLMRYLKQCSDMHDASLSGELEIDQSLEERRVHRKTKSQRDKRGQLISEL